LARSSYYAGIRSIKIRDDNDRCIWNEILAVWDKFGTMGYRPLAAKLQIGKSKIERILNRFRGPTAAVFRHPAPPRKVPNVIRFITEALCQFPEKQARHNWVLRHGKNKYRHVIDPTRPYQLWAGDWKELRLPLMKVTLYIFVIIDCYTRQVMGWEFSIIKDSKAAIRASQMALNTAKSDPIFKPRGLIMHTDQGSAYMASETIRFWRSFGVVVSSADKGKPTQNPYIEAFFSILSRCWLRLQEFNTSYDAQHSIEYFFHLYNSERPHSALNFRTPQQALLDYKSYLFSQN